MDSGGSQTQHIKDLEQDYRGGGSQMLFLSDFSLYANMIALL